MIILRTNNGRLVEVVDKDLKSLKKNRNNIFKGISIVGKDAFSLCSNLDVLDIPYGVSIIEDNDFSLCNKLDEISIPSSVTKIGNISGCKFKYVYKLKNGTVVISNKEKEFDNLKYKLEIDSFYNAFCDLNYSIFQMSDKAVVLWALLSRRLNDLGVKFPCNIIGEDNVEELEFFVKKANYKTFKNIVKLLPDKMKNKDFEGLYRICSALGVFENPSVVMYTGNDNDGKPVYSPVCSVAYTLLQGLFNKKKLAFSKLGEDFNNLPLLGYNEQFLRFICDKSNQSCLRAKNKKFLSYIYGWFVDRSKLDMAINNGVDAPIDEENRFKIKTYNTGDSGFDKVRWNSPTVKLFEYKFVRANFIGVNEENEHIAEYFSKHGQYAQKHFNKAVEIDRERKENNIKDYVIDTPVKEEVVNNVEEYLEIFDGISDLIEEECLEIINYQKDSYFNMFHYEMLSKSDLVNYYLGFLTDCCLTLYGTGAAIQRASIVHPDMQPLVIKDKDGLVVCVGILYINRKEKYGVVNSFEVSKKYKDNDKALEVIYSKVKELVSEFAKQYNKENPNNQLEVITSGISINYGSLNKYIKQNDESDSVLNMIDFRNYGYGGGEPWNGDWFIEQYVLWEKDKIKSNR